MNKSELKQCLQIIDRIELQGMNSVELQESLTRECATELRQVKKEEIAALMEVLLKHRFIKRSRNICDLCVPLTVVARASHGSDGEALGIYECMYQLPALYELMKSHRHSIFSLQTLQEALMPLDILHPLFLYNAMWDDLGEKCYRIKERLLPVFALIDRELSQMHPLLSGVTYAQFIADSMPCSSQTYKNMDKPIVSYMNEAEIQRILPYCGIPESRSACENLQNFYKDNLFHEYDHHCALCGIDIPYMLIASHIKPFRDCGHLIEAADANNGILLCRNHDYLFDQGYLTFDTEGHVKISARLASAQFEDYRLHPNFTLPKKLLTQLRLQFLAYHREHIYRED